MDKNVWITANVRKIKISYAKILLLVLQEVWISMVSVWNRSEELRNPAPDISEGLEDHVSGEQGE